MDSRSTYGALEAALDAVGDRWSLLIVAALLDGPRRFGDLRDALEGIAPNILSARLKRLEQQRLVMSAPYSQRPPRMVYELTESGRELAGALRRLAEWGARRDEVREPPRHIACGTPVLSTWFCPTCEVPVPDPDADDLHYA